MKKTTLVLIFAALLVGTAAMTLAVERPQAIVREAFQNFKESGTFAFKGTMDTVFRAKLPVDDPDVAAPEIALPLHIVGQGAFNIAAESQGGASATRGSRAGTMHLTAADEMTGKELFGLEMRAADTGTTYLKFEGGEAAAATGADISSIADRWFSIDSAAAVFGAEPNKTDNKTWSDLWLSLASGDALSYQEQTASEIIDGSPAWHFILDSRPGAFEDALVDIYGLLTIRAQQQATDEHVRLAMAKHVVSAEIWIDKKTKTVRRFGLAVVPPPSETVTLPLTLVLDLSRYGQSVVVEVPDKVEPLSGAITSLFAQPEGEDKKE